MIRHYLKDGIRSIKSQFRFSVINIIGLVVGISTFVVIVSWVKYERSFDNFHADTDLIYRVVTTAGTDTPNAMALSIGQEVPEVESSVRFQLMSTLTFKVGEQLFYENKVALADPGFFQIFNFPFIVSNAEEALDQPFNIVLTQKMAKKYFGDVDPVGKTILVENKIPAKVTGLIKDIPKNSHLQFDCVVPYKIMKQLGFDPDNWYNWNPNTYIKLSQNENIDLVQSKIQALADKNRRNNTEKFVLQPLNDIHFNTRLDFDPAVTINSSYITILSFGAFLILIISIINFINLSTALYKKRLKEVGVRLTLGAGKIRLGKQIFTETLMLVSVATVLSLIVIVLIKPLFADFLGDDNQLQILTQGSIIGFVLLALIISFISGFLPMRIIASVKPVHILSKRNKIPGDRLSYTQIPVIVQFTLSILLIVGALGISKQLTFIQNADLGFTCDNIICLPVKNNSESKFNSFRSELLKNAGIEMVSIKDHSILGFGNTNGSLDWDGKKPGEKMWVESNYIDENYFKTLGIHFAHGRAFSKEIQSDRTNKIIVNETLVKRILLENPVGKEIKFQGKQMEIVGVIEDAHFQSLHKNIEPQVYQFINFNKHFEDEFLAIVKYTSETHSAGLKNVVEHIEKCWQDIYPEYPFQTSFLSLELENQYKSEQKLTLLMYLFSGMSIFLSCLGLLALSVLSAHKRTKEIGIRKVNGARISEILVLLNKDLIIWVAFSSLIAIPLAWYTLNKWLENFAYKTNLSWWIFALSGLLVMGIALLTVSWQSWRAATRNPVDALRYE